MSAKSKKPSHGYKAVSSKRSHSELSDSDVDIENESEDNTSDFEEQQGQSKKRGKPAAKRQKTEKVVKSTAVSKPGKASTSRSNQAISRIPKWAQCADGVNTFSTGWWKEVLQRDGFWMEFNKRLSKSVRAKRLSVNITLALEDHKIKKEDDESKSKVTRVSKKSTPKTTKGVKTEHVEKKKLASPSDMSNSSDGEYDMGEVDQNLDKNASGLSSVRMRTSEVTRTTKTPTKEVKSEPKQAETRDIESTKNKVDSDGEDDCVIIGSIPSPSKRNIKPQMSREKSKSLSIKEGVANTTDEAKEELVNTTNMTSTEINESTRQSAEEDAVVVEGSEAVGAIEQPKEAAGESVETVHESIENTEQQDNPVSSPAKGDWQPAKF